MINTEHKLSLTRQADPGPANHEDTMALTSAIKGVIPIAPTPAA